MTRDQITDRILKENGRARRSKRRTGRMVRCVLATWPGVNMALPSVRDEWKSRAVAKYQREHREPKRNGREGISPALLFFLAEIIIKLILLWWQNRDVTTADLTRMYLQA